jgi:hypothetical protein
MSILSTPPRNGRSMPLRSEKKILVTFNMHVKKSVLGPRSTNMYQKLKMNSNFIVLTTSRYGTGDCFAVRSQNGSYPILTDMKELVYHSRIDYL